MEIILTVDPAGVHKNRRSACINGNFGKTRPGPGTWIVGRDMCVLWALLHPVMAASILINTSIKRPSDGLVHLPSRTLITVNVNSWTNIDKTNHSVRLGPRQACLQAPFTRNHLSPRTNLVSYSWIVTISIVRPPFCRSLLSENHCFQWCLRGLLCPRSDITWTWETILVSYRTVAKSLNDDLNVLV